MKKRFFALLATAALLPCAAYAGIVTQGDINRLSSVTSAKDWTFTSVTTSGSIASGNDLTVADDATIDDDAVVMGDLGVGTLAYFNGTLDPSGVTFSSIVTGNPFVQGHFQTVTLAQLNAGQTLIAGSTGDKIRVHGVRVYSEGSMAGITAAVVECTGGGDLVSWPVAGLTNNTVNTMGTTNTVLSKELIAGCPAGEGIQIVKTGSTGTTATAIHIEMEYTWQ